MCVCIDEMKSRADWQLETSLLRELVDTVTQRSCIVENMETDRIRYVQDQLEITQTVHYLRYSLLQHICYHFMTNKDVCLTDKAIRRGFERLLCYFATCANT